MKILITILMLCFIGLGQTTFAQNRQLPKAIESFYQAFNTFNTGETALFTNFTAENFTDRMFEKPPADGGKENLVNAIKGFRTAFPDLKITVAKVWKDGNTYICKTDISGTNSGSFFGMPPTNRKVNFSAIDVFELKKGKILNVWHVEQVEKLKEQLTQGK
jgi:steroid delta-isomerase-like uncharacterized protein